MEKNTEKPIVFYFLKKRIKEKNLKIIISLEKKREKVMLLQEKDLSNSEKLMNLFCETIGNEFGRKIY